MDTESSNKILNFGSSSASLIKSLVLFAKDILVLFLALVPIILLFIGLFFVSDYTLSKSNVLLSDVEYAFRCTVSPIGTRYIPFLNTTRLIYSLTVCWTNSVGLLRTLLSDTFLYQQTGLCVDKETSILELINGATSLTSKLLLSLVNWIRENPFTSTLSIYNVAVELTPLSNILFSVLDCLCNVIHPLWKLIILTIQDEKLYCFLQQSVNGLLSIIQVTLNTIVDIILSLIDMIFSGSFLDILTYVDSLQTNLYPRYTYSFDQLSSSMLFLGDYLTNFFINLICIIISEAEQSGNGYNAVENRFGTCKIEAQNIKPGCILGTLFSSVIKAAQIIVQYVLGIFRALNPTDTFRWNVWNPNILYDNIRKPLNIVQDVNFYDSWSDADSTSTIEIVQSYVNISSCFDSYKITNSAPVCLECNSQLNISFETCFCNVMNQFDDLLEPVINRRFIKVLVCDGLFQVVRIAIALFKFLVDVFRTLEITSSPKIIDLLANRVTYDRIIDEIGGPIDEIGGIIYFPNKLIIALIPNHPDLECLVAVFTYLLKAIVESIRLLLYIFQNIVSDIRVAIPGFSATNPFLPGSYTTTFVCSYPYGGTRCFNSETIFKWLRIPRNSSLYFKDFVPLETVFSGNYKEGVAECLCYIINLRFITSFANEIPILSGFELPDICCSIYNIVRAIVGVIQFVLDVILAFFETIFETLQPTYTRIFILDYISCLSNSSSQPCSNINSILTDVNQILICGCTFIQDLVSIPEIKDSIDTGPLDCFCDFFIGGATLVSNALISIRNLLEILIGIFSCISPSTGEFKINDECQIILPLKTVNIFERLSALLVSIRNIIVKIACLLSSIFTYDCLDGIGATPPCLTLDYGSCIQKSCTSYLPNETIGNNLPTSDQLVDCIDQCGFSICTSCNDTLSLIVKIHNTSSLNCPNGCVKPGNCNPSDKLPQLFGSVIDIVVNLIKLLLKWISEIIIFIVQQSSGVTVSQVITIPTKFTDYLEEFLQVLGSSLFGDTESSWGPIQYVGDFLNCIIGPPGCKAPRAMPPSSVLLFPDPPPNPCIGSIFILIGNLIAEIYSAATDVFVNIVIIIEDLITGDFGSIPEHIKNFIISLFELIRVLLGSIELVARLIIGLVAGIFDLIVPGVYDITYLILSFPIIGFIEVLKGIIDLLNFFGANIPTKRFVLLGLENQEEINAFFDKWSNYKNSNNSDNESLRSILEKYQYLFNKSNPFKNYNFSKGESSTGNFTKRNKFSNEEGNDPLLDFKNNYNISDLEMQVIMNPTLLLPLINNDTFCYKVFNRLHDKTFDQMSLSDELMFKICYVLVIIPMVNNNNENSTDTPLLLKMPTDSTYNVNTMLSIANDLYVLIMSRSNWDFPLLHSYSMLYVDDDNNNNNTNITKRGTLSEENGNIINTSMYATFNEYMLNNSNIRNKNFIKSVLENYNSLTPIGKKLENVNKYSELMNKYSQYRNFTFNDYKYSWFISDKEQSMLLDKITSIMTRKRNINYPTDNDEKNTNSFKKASINLRKIVSLIYEYKKIPKSNNFFGDLNKEMDMNEETIKELRKKHDIYLETIKHRKYQIPKYEGSLNKVTYNILFNSIPESYKYFSKKSEGNQKYKNEKLHFDSIIKSSGIRPLKRRSVNDQNTSDNNNNNSSTNGPRKMNGLSFFIQYVIVDRLLLIYDVVKIISINEYNKMSNSSYDYISNIYVQSNNKNNNNNFKYEPSLPQRISIIHSKLSKIKKLNVPDLPKIFTKYSNGNNIGKNKNGSMFGSESIVDVNCNCNCTIIDNFLQEFVDICTYCYEKQFLGIQDPLNITILENSVSIEIIYYDPDNSNINYTFIEDFVYSIIGIDLISTIELFLTNTNTDIAKGPIGLLYFIRRLPIPFIALPCTRINLTCQLGIGIFNGLIISGIIVLIIGVLLYVISPQIGGIVNTIIVGLLFGGSLFSLFVILFLSISWGYQPNCATPDENSFLVFVLPFLANIRMLPECAADEIYNFLVNYIISPCPLDSYSFLGFANLIKNTTLTKNTCPTCPSRIDFISCYDYGFESPFTVFGLFLLKYIPWLGSFLQNSCLVRGNCFGFLLGSSNHGLTNDGILGPLFLNINTTQFLQGTDPVLTECFYLNITSIGVGIIALALITILLLYSIVIFIDLIFWFISIIQLIQTRDESETEYERSKQYLG